MGAELSRWQRMTPSQRRRKLDINNKWRRKNLETVRAWGRRLYRKHDEKRKASSRKYYWGMVNIDPTYRDRMNSKSKENYWKNHRQWTSNILRRSYGVTIEEYERLFAKQHGICGICKQPPGKKSLAIDHCHRTGKIRGLLCVRCNLGLGNLRDDPQLLRAALRWLR